LHDVRPSHALVVWYTTYRHTFSGALANGILSGAKFTLRPSLALSYIGSVTARHWSSGRQRNIVAFSRRRHLYSAGWPSLWASSHILVFGRPFVKRFALCYRSVVCPVCLSVTFVHCGQTVGRIKTKLGLQVSLGLGHIVLDGDPARLHQRGTAPPNFRPISVAAKWLHGSRCHLVRS